MGTQVLFLHRCSTEQGYEIFPGSGEADTCVCYAGCIGWSVPDHRQSLCVIRQWCRLAQMDTGRINKRVFNRAHSHAQEGKKTALFHTIKFHHMDHLCNINNDLVFQCTKEDINVLLTEYYENQWSMKINRESAIHDNGRDKLRTYRTFKQSFETEYYVKTILSHKARQALAQFRCGVTPLRPSHT